VNLLLVTYDLEPGNESSSNYATLIAAIKLLGNAVEVQRSVWLVATSASHSEVADALGRYLRSSDRLFVIPTGPSASGQNPLHEDKLQEVMDG
jgi:hypothetical protein